MISAIDVAHCVISTSPSSGDVKIELRSFTEVPVTASLRSQVLRLCRPNQKEASTCMAEVCDLNFALGREFSRAIRESGVDLDRIDLVASHGQTLWHQPLGDRRSTLQMAEAAVISQATKK
jgi:1,6-anhydro-N-acetylmuramate kinase